MAGQRPEPAALTTPASAPLLHVIDRYFMEQADAAVQAVTRTAFDRLRQAGADFHNLDLPKSFWQAHAMHRCIMAVDAAETHFQSFNEHADDYGPEISKLIVEGFSSFAVDYALALRHQRRFRQDIREIIRDDVIAVTPATVTAAPASLDSTGDPQFNSPWSYAGVPTATIPCGLTDDGLPCGLQLVGAAGSERHLLTVAAWCESVLEFRDSPTSS